MSDTDAFNGWVNRETWAAHLMLSNDEDLYDISCRIVREEDASQTDWQVEHGWETPGVDLGGFAADRFEDWITTAVTEFLHATTSSPDAWRSNEWVRMLIAEVGSFNRVDWNAVAAAFRESN